MPGFDPVRDRAPGDGSLARPVGSRGSLGSHGGRWRWRRQRNGQRRRLLEGDGDCLRRRDARFLRQEAWCQDQHQRVQGKRDDEIGAAVPPFRRRDRHRQEIGSHGAILGQTSRLTIRLHQGWQKSLPSRGRQSVQYRRIDGIAARRRHAFDTHRDKHAGTLQPLDDA